MRFIKNSNEFKYKGLNTYNHIKKKLSKTKLKIICFCKITINRKLCINARITKFKLITKKKLACNAQFKFSTQALNFVFTGN